MIRLVFLAATTVLIAGFGHAQEVRIRSGEHGAFTRLVLQVPPETNWSLIPLESGARLDVDLDGVTYDTGSVFARLTGNRLTALSQDAPGTPLELAFGCDCVATAFMHRQTMLVLDIAPGTHATPKGPAEVPLASPGQLPMRPTVPDDLTGPSLPHLSQNLNQFDEQLMLRVLQGADRGIVDLQVAPPGPRASVIGADGKALSHFPSNVLVSSVLDDLHRMNAPGIAQIDTRPACITNAELGFDTWADSRPFPQQVASTRAELFQEFDKVDPDRVLDLAGIYAFYGFGAEAVELVALLDTAPPRADWIAAIAYVADERDLPGQNPFAGMQRCHGDAALWAALTEQELQAGADLQSIETSFLRLPGHWRRAVGPALSEILVKGQKLEAARRILRAVERIDMPGRPVVSLAKAGVSAAEGDGDKTEGLLSDVVTHSESGIEAPLALARLIEKRWSDRGSVSGKETDLIAAYAIELRDSELGPVMERSHAVALALAQEFDPALDLVRSRDADRKWDGTRDRVLQVLAERSDDLTFLRHTVLLPDEVTGHLSIETAVILSDRLASLGFGTRAHALANRQHDVQRRKDRAVIRARVALLNGHPHKALLELSNDESTQAQLLRARSLAAAGALADSAALFRDLGEAEQADRLFWLAGEQEQADQAPTGKFATMAGLSRSLATPAPRQPDRPLADAAALLSNSADARQNIEQLLATLDQTPPGPAPEKDPEQGN